MRPTALRNGVPLVLVLAVSFPVRGQDKKPSKPADAKPAESAVKDPPALRNDKSDAPLAWNPFEKAAVGDWLNHRFEAFQTTMGCRVAKADGDFVVVEQGARVGSEFKVFASKRWSRSKAPSVGQLFELPADQVVQSCTDKDELIFLWGQTRRAKRYVVETTSADGGTATYTGLLVREVPLGFARYSCAERSPAKNRTVAVTFGGVGTAKGPTLGISEKEPDGARLPWSPGTSAAGDWSALELTQGGAKALTLGQIETVIDGPAGKGASVAISRVTDGKRSPPQRLMIVGSSPGALAFLPVSDEFAVKTTVVEEKRTILGKELACAKCTIVATKEGKSSDGRKARTTNTFVYWVAKEARGYPIVEQEQTFESAIEGDAKPVTHEVVKGTLVGYGTKSAVLLGKKPPELEEK